MHLLPKTDILYLLVRSLLGPFPPPTPHKVDITQKHTCFQSPWEDTPLFGLFRRTKDVDTKLFYLVS